MERKQVPSGYALRIGVRGGGCAALGFVLGFDKPQATDDVFTVEPAIQVLIDKKHTMYLLGITVDWEESDTARGFSFTNTGSSPES